ncbi:MAG: MmcQ/YjbR family DNA-binding protein [Actinomycetota bacterium]|nr:MmcQ/YjbR family DNA-binding protein [Actinomycetota bacterium]
MTDLALARSLALSLPEAVERDHHGMPSFRVRGKIYATVPDDEHVRIMLDEHEIRAAVAENPQTCVELYWGERLSCVVVTLDAASPELLQELITEAWLRKAPKTLTRKFLSA